MQGYPLSPPRLISSDATPKATNGSSAVAPIISHSRAFRTGYWLKWSTFIRGGSAAGGPTPAPHGGNCAAGSTDGMGSNSPMNSSTRSGVRHLPALRGSTIINNFQVFGPHFLRLHREFGIIPHVYIDGTLGEYFDNYRAFDTANIDESAKSRALVAERDSYAVCNKIVAMSNRCAVHLVQHYEVPRDKIHVVLPGANIPERFLYGLDRKRLRPRGSKGKSLTLGFIGLYPQRKGLPTIAGAVGLLRRTGYDIRLHLIGRCPAEIAQQDGVSYLGLIDKRIDIDRFIEVIGNVDIGCMLSRAELAGVALLEFLRMGVPVIGTDVGGIPDIVELGAGLVVAPEIQAAELAEQLARIIDQPDSLIEMQEAAWQRRHNASWRRAVQELKSVLAS